MKTTCQDCGRNYYMQGVKDEARNIRIEPFRPKVEGVCDDCGSTHIAADTEANAQLHAAQLATYNLVKEPLLQFYNRYGLLVDFELKNGYDDYSKLRQQIQYTIKH